MGPALLPGRVSVVCVYVRESRLASDDNTSWGSQITQRNSASSLDPCVRPLVAPPSSHAHMGLALASASQHATNRARQETRKPGNGAKWKCKCMVRGRAGRSCERESLCRGGLVERLTRPSYIRRAQTHCTNLIQKNCQCTARIYCTHVVRADTRRTNKIHTGIPDWPAICMPPEVAWDHASILDGKRRYIPTGRVDR